MVSEKLSALKEVYGRPVDGHVHIVGDGSSGNGCWIRRRGLLRLTSLFMLKEMGLEPSILGHGLDQAYPELLARMLEISSLGAIVILAHEEVYDESGRKVPDRGSFHVPNSVVLELARKYPRFLPAVSIHPARPDAVEELHRTFEEGALIMKCLPNVHNINCSDERYRQFWETMAKLKMPLLAHTGGELALEIVNRQYASPDVLRLPLECGVTVIAAHCGTSSTYWEPDYTERFLAMLDTYPNLYGDNSGLQTPFRSRHIPKLFSGTLEPRLINGSDLPIPVWPSWARLRGLISRAQYLELKNIANPLERDFQLKRALGFSENSFTRLWSLLPLGDIHVPQL